jgi:hypothetical protein
MASLYEMAVEKLLFLLPLLLPLPEKFDVYE